MATAKEKVLKVDPEAFCQRRGGWYRVYPGPQGAWLGMARRENWAWAEAWRKLEAALSKPI
jgi:hypothetical protein